MISVHGFVEAAQHAVGVGTDSSAVKICSHYLYNAYFLLSMF